ncbi:protein midgut expression 1-like [Teleopsis dalmanni]|uniref:protein midgut expression 1-like n=1 Tax=Teleopsis dalmanni TaxID=139649 RepID=UPI0018CC85ED|nr:protein midgut expression 1-like [Teleopsis dalmanni]XP_037944232.1 protein midgut expression 1-like [Teleopsis dalmanni]
MCKACWECIKCPGKVFCCCCECACNMLLGFICSGLVLLIIIGLIVYFTVFYNKNNGGVDDGSKIAEKLVQQTPQNFRDYFNMS